jgi:hypothetical protein
VRYPDGFFDTFDAPDADTGVPQGTLAWNINPEGVAAGIYIDGSGVYHGFVRSRDGRITQFDPPGSIYTYPCEETCLSPDGTLTGFYLDSEYTLRGFVRTPDGGITNIDAPGAGTGGYLGAIAASIAVAAITGYIEDANVVGHGFTRYPNGSFATFNAPGSCTGTDQGTRSSTNNQQGAVAGWFWDQNGLAQGFLWTPLPTNQRTGQ